MAANTGSLRSTDTGDAGSRSLRSATGSDDAQSNKAGGQSADGNEKDGKDKNKMTDLERAQAIAEVRYYAAAHREAVDAMLDGVTLGAEQVQNKRLDLLEAGPESTGLSSPLVSMVLTFVLEGTIGPAIAAAVTQRVLRGIFMGLSGAAKLRVDAGRLESEIRLLRDRASAVRDVLPSLRGRGMRGIRLISAQADDLERLAGSMATEAARNHSDARAISRAWREMSEGLALNLVAGAKAAREEALRPEAGDAAGGGQTTAGVSAMSDAMEEAAKMRLGIAAAAEGNIWFLMQPASTTDDAAKILKNFRPNTFDLGAMRDAFALLSEAVIWAKQLKLSGKTDSSGKPILDDSVTGLAVTDQRLREYLRVRFGKAAKAWAASQGIVDQRQKSGPSNPGPVSAGTPEAPASVGGGPAVPMEGGGFAGGPQDVLTPEEKLLNELDWRLDILIQLYLSAIGQQEENLGRELS